MGLVKKKMMEYEEVFKGSDERIAMLGGFLDIQIDNSTICTASIPIPDFLALRYRDSVSDWSEEFEDLEGNSYIANVYSSLYGVNWEIIIKEGKNSLEEYNRIVDNISKRIKIEIHYTEAN